jgi:DNA-binding PucR family transcriptional regulator
LSRTALAGNALRALPQPRAQIDLAHLARSSAREILDKKQLLVDTLHAYIAQSRNLSATGRALPVSTRAVPYRLERIAQLTGYSMLDPHDRFILELAVRARALVTE